jgi:hypothetical protein
MGLCAGGRRVDVAVINGELSGFEIKSDHDTLARLSGQAADYGRVLDRVTLLTTNRYLAPAVEMLPTWWQIIRAEPSKPHPCLTLIRQGTRNDSQDAMAIAQLLWREEALMELRRRGLGRGMGNKRRWLIWERLAMEIPMDELKTVVRDQLRARQDWPGGQ